ncbi:unnamed protein product [Moneuplotes crassus]|uniref:Uncharacterized protein n=1 Tax=Euplotes crassus TaxID=5936 RepID=A0AAD1Y6X1_EUPCR|nr:unnamed protein product [Moneuplotes crassus]
MELDPNDSILFKEKIQRLSVAELDQILEEAKSAIDIQESKQDQHLARLEWMRMRLTIYNIKSCEENLKVFEDLYQNLVSPEPENEEEVIPLKYKADFLNLFLDIFMYNGGYTRCQVIMEIFKDLLDDNPTDDFVAFKYYSAYLSVAINYMTLTAETPEEYIAIISEDISARTFCKEASTHLNWLEKYLRAKFYISRDFDKWLLLCDELLAICKSTKSFAYIRALSNPTSDNKGNFDKKLKDRINLIISLAEKELQTHPEPDLAECQIGINIAKIPDILEAKDKGALSKLINNLEDLMKHHRLNKCSTLYNQITCCMCIFGAVGSDNLEYSSDQDIIFRFNRDLEKLIVEATYETNYCKMESFGIAVAFEEIIGALIDYKVVKKYADTIKQDKLTYIAFMGSFSIINDFGLKSYVETALEYCEDLGIGKLHQFRIDLDFTDNFLAWQMDKDSNKAEAMANFDSLAKLYEQNRNPVTEKKLEVIYSIQLTMAEKLCDPEKYVEAAQKYLATQKVPTEANDIIYTKISGILYRKGDVALANKVCNDFINYAKNAGENTKSFQKALTNKLTLCLNRTDSPEFVEFSQNYEQVTKNVYGQNSMEHAHAIKLLSQGKMLTAQYQEAYQKALDCYDIYKAQFGSEVNSESSGVLTDMAFIKSRLCEFEDADNLIKKAKEIEQKITSKYSPKYYMIRQGEDAINKKRKRLEAERKLLIGDRQFSKTKLTLGLIGIGLAAFGAIYYIKSKKSE